MTVTVEHDHLSPRGTGQTVPMYRCHCGELHASQTTAHQCRHRAVAVSRQDLPEHGGSYVGDHTRAMPKSHGRPSGPSLFDQEDHRP